MAIYITSDLHIGHDRDFMYGRRGFDNIYDHDAAIIKNFNEILTDDDELYILGDVMLKDLEYGKKIFNQIPGIKHIILGNHDTGDREELYPSLRGVVDISYGARLKYGKYRFFLSHYPSLTANFDDEEPLKKKVINIAGHSHTKDKFADIGKGLIYHVELDAHDMKPVNIETIIEDLKFLKED